MIIENGQFLGASCHIWSHEASYSFRSPLGSVFLNIYILFFVKIWCICGARTSQLASLRSMIVRCIPCFEAAGRCYAVPVSCAYIQPSDEVARRLLWSVALYISLMPKLAVCEEPHKKNILRTRINSEKQKTARLCFVAMIKSHKAK